MIATGKIQHSQNVCPGDIGPETTLISNATTEGISIPLPCLSISAREGSRWTSFENLSGTMGALGKSDDFSGSVSLCKRGAMIRRYKKLVTNY